MKVSKLKGIAKVIRHLKRYYPDIPIGFKRETNNFIEIYVGDPLTYCNSNFIKRRDYCRKVHGSNIGKPILFVRWDKPSV